jgi:hypothetical protein
MGIVSVNRLGQNDEYDNARSDDLIAEAHVGDLINIYRNRAMR